MQDFHPGWRRPDLGPRRHHLLVFRGAPWIPCALLLLGLILNLNGSAALKPNPVSGLKYDRPFVSGAQYAETIPTQESIVGFPVGQRAATAEEIERCLKAWSDKSRRLKLVEYGRTYENRPLYYCLLTSPKNQEKAGEIRSQMARLADPRNLAEAEARSLIDATPPAAWLGFTIHGDETEGSDAALVLIYHLLADGSPATESLLDDLVIIIDPLMNPDGRSRFLKMVAEHRGVSPNLDDQSLLHEGYLPWGRGNHYLADMNRDGLAAVHPETRSRLREINRWNPVLFVDAHGMGAQDTHLFSPPREPVNPHFPKGHDTWGETFARDQARAFDQQGLVYYHGEWNENWFPGYMDSYSALRGGVGILYEQARVAENGIRRPGGRILSYAESVHHHVIGALANLSTLRAHRKDLLQRFWETRRTAVSPSGPYANHSYALPPSDNLARRNRFMDVLTLHGFESCQLTNSLVVPLAADQLGRETRQVTLPAGTILIPSRQPLAHHLAALLDFDPRINEASLKDERHELLARGGSRIYDTTAWNLTMMFGLEALILPLEPPAGTPAYTPPKPVEPALLGDADSAVALVVDGTSDDSTALAARLLEQGVAVRATDRAFTLDRRNFARGSVVFTRLDNRALGNQWIGMVQKTAEELRLQVHAVQSGLGQDFRPDLGSDHFVRLEAPRIAVLARGGISSQDFGAVWQALDHELAIRHSHLNEDTAGHAHGNLDLGRYNVLVLPERASGSLTPAMREEIKSWVRSGGTLIASGSSAAELAAEKADVCHTRTLPEVLGKLDVYEQKVLREWQALRVVLPAGDRLWDHKATAEQEYPWPGPDGPQLDEKELKKRDAWQSLFMPQGALLAARTDAENWLTFGTPACLPVLAGAGPVLMAVDPVEAPIRFGFLVAGEPKAGVAAADKEEKKTKSPPRIGWAVPPAGFDLYLRMSGLLWPEAGQRLANSAYVTREAVGQGQVILFASSPVFRGISRGTMRIFLNAVVYGPGLGTAPRITP
jgi:hypothetical protein